LPDVLRLAHGDLPLPAFMPDATLGVVRTLDAADVEACGVDAVVMNVFHLMQRPGSSTIRALGGLHEMFGWRRPIMTDSGGFQAYSLIRENPRYGAITDRGILYRPEGSQRRVNLTPEKSVQLQMAYGADVVVCLDDCTSAEAPYAVQREAVERTVAWARRCREAYDQRLRATGPGEGERPLLFGVVQGGNEPDLRRACAEALLELGFDGYGLGGWPLDAEGNLLADIIGYLREQIPPEFPMHALGVGHPQHVVDCYRMGYPMFDSSMPTRDARHGRLLVMHEERGPLVGDWFSYLYVRDEHLVKDGRPVSETCDCLVCRRYSRAYLRHLYAIKDGLYNRLATIHNLRFMMRLMERLREGDGER
jgi:queuine tRNA-ribosyltransferase